MTTTTPGEARPDRLDEDEVAEYLRGDPEFLARRPELLAALHVPHRAGDGAVSLIEHQVRTLRERNERLQHQLQDLVHTARDNQRVGGRLVALGRGLLEADSLDAVLAFVRDALLNEFSADYATIRLIDTPDGRRAERDPDRFLAADAPQLALFETCLQAASPVCGNIERAQLDALFGDIAPPASAAIVPLVAGRPLGLIALGSRDAGHFDRDMGTLFLGQLGELVTTGVARHLDRA